MKEVFFSRGGTVPYKGPTKKSEPMEVRGYTILRRNECEKRDGHHGKMVECGTDGVTGWVRGLGVGGEWK